MLETQGGPAVRGRPRSAEARLAVALAAVSRRDRARLIARLDEPVDQTDARPVSTWEWLAVVRRARLGRGRTLVLVMLATYANPDGTGIRPGRARVAADCELSVRTVHRHMTWARTVRLITLTRRGNRRRSEADEYRLTLPPDLETRVTVPTPEEYAALIAALSRE